MDKEVVPMKGFLFKTIVIYELIAFAIWNILESVVLHWSWF